MGLGWWLEEYDTRDCSDTDIPVGDPPGEFYGDEDGELHRKDDEEG